ncbi:MAG: glycoside hydrolase family 88 protein [Spirochaetes bacterium]|nr:glycoside hydrolase family 88 protein [Spirochaetota bacterium]
MRFKIIAINILFVLINMNINSSQEMKNNMTISVSFAEMIIKKWPDPTTITQKGWEYNNSIVLHGIEKVYKKTGNKKYLDYIKKWVDYYIDESGNINFDKSANNLDHIHPGLLLLFLYEETGLEKYKKAAIALKNELVNQPRNKEGGFWHKDIYKNEMWLDGIYMAEPFLIKFGYLFNDSDYCNDESTFQAILIANHAQDQNTGLLYHGWDEDKDKSWADEKTGVSGFVWSRGMGWYMMALVDMLDYLPKEHKNYKKIIDILSRACEGLKRYQDQKTGLWFQVIDKKNEKANWIETSGSAMFIYTIKKAVVNNYIGKEYLQVAEKGFKGLKSFITYTKTGDPVINQAVEGMGVQISYKSYIYKAKLSNSSHGLCGILMAGSVMGTDL